MWEIKAQRCCCYMVHVIKIFYKFKKRLTELDCSPLLDSSFLKIYVNE